MIRRHHEICPPFARVCDAAPIRNRLERADHGSADGDHAMAGGSCRIHAIGGFGWHSKALFVRWLVIFEARDTRMKSERRDLNSVCDETRDQLGRKRAPCG